MSKGKLYKPIPGKCLFWKHSHQGKLSQKLPNSILFIRSGRQVPVVEGGKQVDNRLDASLQDAERNWIYCQRKLWPPKKKSVNWKKETCLQDDRYKTKIQLLAFSFLCIQKAPWAAHIPFSLGRVTSPRGPFWPAIYLSQTKSSHLPDR